MITLLISLFMGQMQMYLVFLVFQNSNLGLEDWATKKLHVVSFYVPRLLVQKHLGIPWEVIQ